MSENCDDYTWAVPWGGPQPYRAGFELTQAPAGTGDGLVASGPSMMRTASSAWNGWLR